MVSQENDLVVVIPTYKEIDNLKNLLPKVFELPIDILIIDDASHDGTSQLIEKFKSEGRSIELLERSGKLGLGSAYKEGFALSLSKSYQGIIQMDADGSHRTQDLPKLISTFRNNPEVNLVIGSRWIKGGAVENWPKRREILSRGANIYARIMLGLKTRDCTAGYRIYRSTLLEKMDLGHIKSEGYGFQIEMTREAARVGAKIVEVPILFVERELGVSKMSGQIIWEALIKVTLWGFARVIGR